MHGELMNKSHFKVGSHCQRVWSGLFLILLLIGAPNRNAQGNASLQISLKVTKSRFTRKVIPATVLLKNIGATPVVIPMIDTNRPENYFSFQIFHKSSNTEVAYFRVPPFGERGISLPDATELLQPNGERSFNMTINTFGSGLYGLANPQDESSIRRYSGLFDIRASFTVESYNLPTNGDITHIWTGTVISSPVTFSVK